MKTLTIILIVVAVLAAILAGLYFLSKHLQKKMSEQQALINQYKMTTSILVLSKKKQKMSEANLPKAVEAQVPKTLKFRKMPIVKAKVGPQITTLLCDEKVFDALPTKKQVKVEIAGIYIVGIKSVKGGNINTNTKKKKKGFFSKLKKGKKEEQEN